METEPEPEPEPQPEPPAEAEPEAESESESEPEQQAPGVFTPPPASLEDLAAASRPKRFSFKNQ
jgi:hypothetical protein